MRALLLLLLVFSPGLSLAKKSLPLQVESRKAEDLEEVPYRLSKAGIERIEENLKIMDFNIDNMRQSLDTSKKNIRVLRQELASLFELEQEHVALQNKYSKYLSNVQSQRKKNEAGIKRLESWKKSLDKMQASRENSEYKSALRKAEQEAMNRLLWKEDAEFKEKQVLQLQLEAERNLGRLRVHREEVKRELEEWQKRSSTFERQLAQLKERKGKYAKIYEVQKKASPF